MNCLTIIRLIFKIACKLNIPTVNEDFKMVEIHSVWFLVIAIVLAIVVGRLGTILREQIEKVQFSKLKKHKTNELS